MIESSDWPAFRFIKIIIIIGLLSQHSCAGGLKISLDCDEGPQAITGNGNDWALNFQDVLSLLLSPFISDANAQDDYQTYKNSKIKFESEGTVTGKGFTNVRNRMEDAGNDSLSRSLHGSGSYSSETAASYYSIIANEVPDEIAEEFGYEGDTNGTSDSQFSALKTSNLSAAYYATSFYPFGQTYLKFSSKWSDTTKAKSDQNTESFLESYRHATKINKSSDLTIYPYEIDSKLDADFQGAADIQYSSPENCFQDSYIGSYDLMQDLSSDQLIHSSTGTGFANIDRKLMENGLQRTYAHGSGDLVLDEKIGPESNHIEKSIKLIYKPTEFAVNPGNSLNLSSKWSEGVSSQTDDHIRLSESFTDIELMDKEIEVTDLTSAGTEVNYTGRGEYIRHPAFPIRHPASVIRHLPSVIRHPAFAIRLFCFPIPRSAFRIPHSSKGFERPHQLAMPGGLVAAVPLECRAAVQRRAVVPLGGLGGLDLLMLGQQLLERADVPLDDRAAEDERRVLIAGRRGDLAMVTQTGSRRYSPTAAHLGARSRTCGRCGGPAHRRHGRGN